MTFDTDLNGLALQPGFVEGIVVDQTRFATIEAMFQHLFRNNREYAILLWNGLPVRLSYCDDLPSMMSALVLMLDEIQRGNVKSTAYKFETPNLKTYWEIEIDQDTITIEGFWHRVSGNYETALNRFGLFRMLREDFLCEWKLLLQQFIQAVDATGVCLAHQDGIKTLTLMRKIEAKISNRGRFYQYDTVGEDMKIIED